MGGGLLDSIQQGKKLRTVTDEEKERPVSSQSSLLSSIRQGANLKKVEVTEKKEQTADEMGMFGGEEISAMLARRKWLEMDSDSDDSDSDWD